MRSMVVGARLRHGAIVMTAATTTDVKSLLRKDFFAFLVRCFGELHGGQQLSPAWHAEVLALKLQRIGQGQVKRLIVNVPPRHLKSLAASVALPAWLLGHGPSLAIINVTYAQDLSDKFARDCRAIMMSDWYQADATISVQPHYAASGDAARGRSGESGKDGVSVRQES